MIGQDLSHQTGNPLLTDDRFARGFFSGLYFLLGATALGTKFLAPILVASAEGSIWLIYVKWDLWWTVYLWIGWKLQRPSRKVWKASMCVGLLDFCISAYTLVRFVFEPLWDPWKTALFIHNLAAFAIAFLFLFYLRSESTRQEFGMTA